MSLKERRDITELHQHTGGGVLFTLVQVRGSSYRRAGARLLAAGREHAGTLSGGCLEADLLQRASWYVRSGPALTVFNTAFDETSEVPYGLGCGGEITVLAEGAASPDGLALLAALRATVEGERRFVVTRLPEPGVPLARLVLNEACEIVYQCATFPVTDVVAMTGAAFELRHTERSSSMLQGADGGRLFLEMLMPVQRLVIFGAGDDALPLVQMAQGLGWRVLVVDTRSHRASQERFPGVEVRVAGSAAVAGVTGADAAVVMTHSYEQDRSLVAELLPAPPRFVGLLGARHRSALLLSEAAETAGVTLSAAADAIHAPVGLELGGEGPESIALAVLAEIQHSLCATGPAQSRRMSAVEVERLFAAGLPPLPAQVMCFADAAKVSA